MVGEKASSLAQSATFWYDISFKNNPINAPKEGNKCMRKVILLFLKI